MPHGRAAAAAAALALVALTLVALALAALALAAGGNSADTAEEGFMVDDPGMAQEDTEGSADLGQVEAFFKLIGERAVGAREEPVAIMSEKSAGFDAKKKRIKAEASKPMYIAPVV